MKTFHNALFILVVTFLFGSCAPTQQQPGPPQKDFASATRVPGKEGFVFSPYNNKPIDVRGIQSGTLVQDPYYPAAEKKYFRVPGPGKSDLRSSGSFAVSPTDISGPEYDSIRKKLRDLSTDDFKMELTPYGIKSTSTVPAN